MKRKGESDSDWRHTRPPSLICANSPYFPPPVLSIAPAISNEELDQINETTHHQPSNVGNILSPLPNSYTSTANNLNILKQPSSNFDAESSNNLDQSMHSSSFQNQSSMEETESIYAEISFNLLDKMSKIPKQDSKDSHDFYSPGISSELGEDSEMESDYTHHNSFKKWQKSPLANKNNHASHLSDQFQNSNKAVPNFDTITINSEAMSVLSESNNNLKIIPDLTTENKTSIITTQELQRMGSIILADSDNFTEMRSSKNFPNTSVFDHQFTSSISDPFFSKPRHDRARSASRCSNYTVTSKLYLDEALPRPSKVKRAQNLSASSHSVEGYELPDVTNMDMHFSATGSVMSSNLIVPKSQRVRSHSAGRTISHGSCSTPTVAESTSTLKTEVSESLKIQKAETVNSYSASQNGEVQFYKNFQVKLVQGNVIEVTQNLDETPKSSLDSGIASGIFKSLGSLKKEKPIENVVKKRLCYSISEDEKILQSKHDTSQKNLMKSYLQNRLNAINQEKQEIEELLKQLD